MAALRAACKEMEDVPGGDGRGETRRDGGAGNGSTSPRDAVYHPLADSVWLLRETYSRRAFAPWRRCASRR
ncbi:MAG: hypothetical protein ACLUEQ_06050 [Cloacibacillus evryensis]